MIQTVNVAICDDDDDALLELEAYVENYFIKESIPYKIYKFSSSAEFIEEFNVGKFQIVILDILIDELSGIELAKIIFSEDKNTVIAFISNTSEYVFDGYGVNAVSYCLKPIEQNKIDTLIGNCYKRFISHNPQNIIIKSNDGIIKVNVDHIIYLESKNKKIDYVCINKTITTIGKLSDIEQTLPSSFIRTHKSFIVNLNQAKLVKSNSVFTFDNHKIPISRINQKKVLNEYFNYVHGKL